MRRVVIRTFLAVAALGAAGCSTPAGGPAPLEFTGRLLLAVPADQGRSIAQFRAAPGAAVGGGGQWRFDALKLTRSEPRGPAAGRGRTWVVATPTRAEGPGGARSAGNPWDECHKVLDGNPPERYRGLLTELSRAAGGEVKPLAVEPDVLSVQPREPPSYVKERQETFHSRTDGNTATVCHDTSAHWPVGKDLAWHLGDRYTQLKSAREYVAARFAPKDPSRRIRVAIIDTGYDANHVANPPGLNREESRDFSLDPGNPKPGAVDPLHTGFLTMPGHGCGVMSILAGNRIAVPDAGFDDYLGGAPQVEIVMLRISDSVVHLSPVTMAFALQHATQIGADVVSISHGGLPCQLLADAVNDAYDNGVALFAASGDYFKTPLLGLSSPQTTVYPAAFDRVVSVCGATATGRTYSQAPSWLTLFTFRHWGQWMLRGSYGPRSLMDEAIAAYAPNVPWARFSVDLPANLLDRDGAGTSAATPQVSAAAALWLQAHREDPALAAKWRTWEKAEAVYWALFDSAEKKTPEGADTFKYFGNGLLRARRALDLGVPPKMQKRPEAKVGMGWLRLYFGILVGVRDVSSAQPTEAQLAHEGMLQTELAQLVHESIALQELIATHRIDSLRERTPPAAVKLFLQTAARDRNCSAFLRKALRQRAEQL